MNKFTHSAFKTLLLLAVMVAGVENTFAWRGAKVTVTSSPTAGGYVMASTSSSGTVGTKTSDETSSYNLKTSTQNFTFYLFAQSKTGYTFKGWSTSSSATSGTVASPWQVVLSGTSGVSYTTYSYYAIFSANKYSVAFNGNGATSGSMSNQSFVYDAAQNLTANAFARKYTVTYAANGGTCSTPSADASYTFAGWATSTNGAKAYDNQASVSNLTATAGGTVNLYALWNSASVTLPSASKSDGSLFDGWYNGDTKIGNAGDSYTPTANITLTAHWVSKYDLELTSNIPATVHVGDELQNVFTFTHADNPGNAVTVVSIDAINNGNGKVLTYDAANNKIVAENAGTAKITFTQAATSTMKAGTKEVTVAVVKNENPITLRINDTETNTISLGRGEEATLDWTSNSESAFTCSAASTNSNNVAVFGFATKKLTAMHTTGACSWTINQAENYKYKAGSATFTATVADVAETTCYIYLSTSGWEPSCSDFGQPTIPGPGQAKTLIYKGKHQSASVSPSITPYQLVDGNWVALEKNSSLSTSFAEFSAALDANATAIKFESAGTLTKYVTDVRVTRKTYLNAEDLLINQTSAGEEIYPGQTGVGNLLVDWSIANGGDLKIANDNPADFTLSQYTITGTDCAAAKTNITVSYKAHDNAAGDDVAHLVIYNSVFRKEVTLTGKTVKRSLHITWKENIDMLSLNQEVVNPASVSLSGSVITYSSSNTDVIQVINGNTLKAVGPGTAVITANATGNSEYSDAEDTKEIEVTSNAVQRIVWSQSLLGLKLGDEDVTLTAKATSDEACTTNNLRTITYTSNNTAVVSVSGDQLHIEGIGTTYITATQAGGVDADGHTYAEVSVTKKVVVRDPNAECITHIYEQESEHEFSLGWNALNKQTMTKEIDFNGQEPGFYSFDYKGEVQKVAIEYYDGTMSVEQYVNNEWEEVQSLGKPEKGTYQSTGVVALNRAATKMRVKVTNGLGYQYFKDCAVSLARYIEPFWNGNMVSELTYEAKCGESPAKTLTINYSNIQGNLLLTLSEGAPFSLSTEIIEGTCGDRDTKQVSLTYNPTVPETNAEYSLTISDGKTAPVVITLHATATQTERRIVWNQTPAATVYHTETVTLNAWAQTLLGDPAGDIEYTIVSASPEDFATLTDNVLSFSTGGVVTIAASVAADAAYTTPSPIQKTWTITRLPAVSFEGTDAEEPLVWGAEDNWDSGYVPTAEDNVIINSDVVVVGNVEVKSLTIASNVTATVYVNGTLTVGDGNSADVATYGNLIVEDNAKVILGSGTLKVNDFVIESVIGDDSNASTSGQVTNAANLDITGDVFIDITLDPSGAASYGWYAFTVPFPVSIKDGVYFGAQKLTNERDYAIMQYQGDVRATGAYGWIKSYKVDNILHPGVFYLITVGDTDYATLRFKKTADGQLNNAQSSVSLFEFAASGSGSEVDEGWNGVGNPSLSYQNISFGGDKVQVFNHADNKFDAVTTNDHSFVVGSPFFAQSTGASDVLNYTAVTDATLHELRAPARSRAAASGEFCVRLGNDEQTYLDQLYLSATDDALTTYEKGHDLAKMSMSAAKVPQLSVQAYGLSLCDAELPFVNGEATFPLLISAPAAGEYTLYQHTAQEGATLYLLQDGQIVWNLSESAYTIELSKGNTSSYSLLIHRQQGIATDLETADASANGAEKLIHNGQLIIRTGNRIFNATGKRVK